jgi:hypothetical protein
MMTTTGWTTSAVGVSLVLAVVWRASADAPAGRYTIDAMNGVVTDTKTGLVWQQVVFPGTYIWADAKSYFAALGLAGGGWRLPARKELETLVDESRSTPAIDPTAFPSTPSDWFWSSSAAPVSYYGGWGVCFGSLWGGDTNRHRYESSIRVRCVR